MLNSCTELHILGLKVTMGVLEALCKGLTLNNVYEFHFFEE